MLKKKLWYLMRSNLSEALQKYFIRKMNTKSIEAPDCSNYVFSTGSFCSSSLRQG